MPKSSVYKNEVVFVYMPIPKTHWSSYLVYSSDASMSPAKEVGGDFYDFFYINETHFAFLIADVSGKGIPAALFMMNAKSIKRLPD